MLQRATVGNKRLDSKQENPLASTVQHMAESRTTELRELAILALSHHSNNQRHLHTASDKIVKEVVLLLRAIQPR